MCMAYSAITGVACSLNVHPTTWNARSPCSEEAEFRIVRCRLLPEESSTIHFRGASGSSDVAGIGSLCVDFTRSYLLDLSKLLLSPCLLSRASGDGALRVHLLSQTTLPRPSIWKCRDWPTSCPDASDSSRLFLLPLLIC